MAYQRSTASCGLPICSCPPPQLLLTPHATILDRVHFSKWRARPIVYAHRNEDATNQALDSATAIHAKELAEVNAEEKQLLLSTDAFENSIQVLSTRNDADVFLQLDRIHVPVPARETQELPEGVLTHFQRKAHLPSGFH